MQDATQAIPIDSSADFIRRHIHDMRNHVNGVAMEMLLLEGAVTDDAGREALRRARDEIGHMESALASLSLRAAPATRQVVPALDVFTLWRSKVGREQGYGEVEWTCDLDSELVDVDMKAVAGVLCELTECESGDGLGCAARGADGGVVYEIAGPLPDDGVPGRVLLPGLEQVVGRSGGRLLKLQDPGPAQRLSRVWFPCASARPGA